MMEERKVTSFKMPVGIALKGGFHSQVTLLPTTESVIVKAIGIRDDMHMSLEDAEELASRIQTYRQKLQEQGLRISAYTNIEVQHYGKKRYVLLTKDPYCGVNMTELLMCKSDENCNEMVRNLLDSLMPLFAGSSGGASLPVGFDPKPDNFTIDFDGNYTFVDLMPPRFCDDGKYLLEITEPKTEEGRKLALWRYYNPAGILTVLFTQLNRIRPKQFKSLMNVFKKWLWDNKFEYLYTHFRDLESLLPEHLDTTNPILLRYRMCQLSELNGTTPEQVESFFRMTHFEEFPTQEVLSNARVNLWELYKQLEYSGHFDRQKS